MKVEALEYGDNSEAEYREDFNSFKIFTVWSEPDVKITDDSVPVEAEDLEEKDSSKEANRLATVVEFPMTVGGYFFVERPDPTPDWLEKVFNLLKGEGWQGHALRDFRVDCRGDIKIEEGEDWTAVIDERSEKVFHNRRKRDGEIESLKDFEMDEGLKGVEAEIIRVEESKAKVELENGHKIWLDDRSGASKDLEGDRAVLTLVMVPGSVITDSWDDIQESLCIESLSSDDFACKVVAKVTGYDVEDEWPKAKSEYGYPLVELDAGIGEIVTAHENVHPVKKKQEYHEEGSKWKVNAKSLMLEDLEKIS